MCVTNNPLSYRNISDSIFCLFDLDPLSVVVTCLCIQECEMDVGLQTQVTRSLYKGVALVAPAGTTNGAGRWWCAASIMRPLSRGRPRDNSAVHGASEDVPGMTYDVPGVSYPIPWTSGDCPQGVRPAEGPGTHSLASTGPFSQAAVHRASGLLRFSQSQRGRIMDRKWGCPQYVRNRKLMSRSCPGNATATLLAALTFFVKNKLILL